MHWTSSSPGRPATLTSHESRGSTHRRAVRRRGRGTVRAAGVLAAGGLCALFPAGAAAAVPVSEVVSGAAPASVSGSGSVPTATPRGHADPATSVPGLVVPGTTAAADARAHARGVGSGVTTTPAEQARLEKERAAAAATARAIEGADPGFSRPVEGVHQTSGYGKRWGRLHAGLDFAGPVGQMVRSVSAGTVTFAGEQSGYGNLVEVQHEDGSFTRYAHLDEIHAAVGDEVTRAQRVGTLGNSGRSTGPHLHFEVRTPAGTPVDPLPWMRQRGIVPVEATP